MSEGTWTYKLHKGGILAQNIRRNDIPYFEYPITICGDGGPSRTYLVHEVDESSRTIILVPDYRPMMKARKSRKYGEP